MSKRWSICQRLLQTRRPTVLRTPWHCSLRGHFRQRMRNWRTSNIGFRQALLRFWWHRRCIDTGFGFLCMRTRSPIPIWKASANHQDTNLAPLKCLLDWHCIWRRASCRDIQKYPPHPPSNAGVHEYGNEVRNSVISVPSGK